MSWIPTAPGLEGLETRFQQKLLPERVADLDGQAPLGQVSSKASDAMVAP